MSVSEISLESKNYWNGPVENPPADQDLSVREVILDGLDKETKNGIIEYLKENCLNVQGVDNETYTVNLSKWDLEKSKRFIGILRAMGGKFREVADSRNYLESANNCEEHENTEFESRGSTRNSGSGNSSDEDEDEHFTEVQYSETVRPEGRLPVFGHTQQDLDFEYIVPKPRLQPAPIYQKEELLNVKPLLISEETKSTMGSAEAGVTLQKPKKSVLKKIKNFFFFPFKFLKRLKILRYIRKKKILNKSNAEKTKNEKAFAVYSTMLQEGPRLGREFRDSLVKPEPNAWRTVATNTLAAKRAVIEDDYSVTSGLSKINVGINAVTNMVEAAVNTQTMLDFYKIRMQHGLSKAFNEPEEEVSKCCPCQVISRTSVCKSFAKCLKYLCDWEIAGPDVAEDIKCHKAELVEVKRLLVVALNLLATTQPVNADEEESEQ